jgi:lipoate-protein ligase A
VPRETLGAYRLFHGILARALRRLGVPAELRGGRRLLSDTGAGENEFWCFYHSTAFDLAARGRKLVGSAQRRTARGFLMHGSLPLARNPLTPATADAATTRAALETSLLAEWTTAFGEAPEPGEPTPAEREEAERLAAERYRNDEWTFRRSFPREVR